MGQTYTQYEKTHNIAADNFIIVIVKMTILSVAI